MSTTRTTRSEHGRREPRREGGAREEVEHLADEIGWIAGHLAVATHRLLACVRRFDALGGWAAQGALSCADWLSSRIGLTPGAAREKVRVARALGSLPKLDDALRRGLLSYSKVRALTRVATPETEATLLDLARAATGGQLERLCRGYAQARAAERGAPLHERCVRWRELKDGMVRIEATLPREEAAVVWKALDAALPLVARRGAPAEAKPVVVAADAGTKAEEEAEAEADTEVGTEREEAAAADTEAVAAEAGADTEAGTEREEEAAADTEAETETEAEAGKAAGGGVGPGASSPEPYVSVETHAPPIRGTRADALLAVCDSFLVRGPPAAAVPGRYEVVLHVDEPLLRGVGPSSLCELEDGTPLRAETARRLACDAALVPARPGHGGGSLDFGRRRRTIPPALRRALQRRDGGCRFPGCSNRVFVDGHYVRPCAQGGTTTLDDIVLLCRRHHTLVHEGGFAVEVVPGRPPRFRDPRGRDLAPAPTVA